MNDDRIEWDTWLYGIGLQHRERAKVAAENGRRLEYELSARFADHIDHYLKMVGFFRQNPEALTRSIKSTTPTPPRGKKKP